MTDNAEAECSKIVGSHEDMLGELYEQPGAYSGPSKKSFRCSDDIILLIATNDAKPWAAPTGTLMKAWADIATDLKRNRRFGVDKDGPGCKTRFDKLVKFYKEESLAAMRRSGTDEEFGECEQLLEDIVAQVSDFESEKATRDEQSARKKEGVEASGVTMRRLAMEALDNSDGEDGAAKLKCKNVPPAMKRSRVRDLFDHISSVVDSATEDPSVMTMTKFLKERLEQEDIREEKRARRDEERDRLQHERDLARDKQMQEFFVTLIGAVRRS
ncbi:hypothetical protein DYB32_005204 [Aphanomyces invadans]|uniref:Myb-like domain-containing protein n=1 Tax=Aphanomyces invadans TaxID=157072 RepID=A0A3R6YYI6_9STRA|nr:hypothetical protein DYB32_005204 [Aphanomyces invadans]